MVLDFCEGQVKQHKTHELPGYKYKPCVIIEGSCPSTDNVK